MITVKELRNKCKGLGIKVTYVNKKGERKYYKKPELIKKLQKANKGGALDEEGGYEEQEVKRPTKKAGYMAAGYLSAGALHAKKQRIHDILQKLMHIVSKKS